MENELKIKMDYNTIISDDPNAENVQVLFDDCPIITVVLSKKYAESLMDV